MNAIQHLVEIYGSEELAQGKVEEYIKPFGGLITFDTGAEIKATEHGWVNPNKPEEIGGSPLSSEYLNVKIDENKSNTGYENADITFDAELVGVGTLFDCTAYVGGEKVDTKGVNIKVREGSWERKILMKDIPPFTAKSGKEVPAKAMATLFANLRGAVGAVLEFKGIRVSRKYDEIDREYLYYFESGNYTDVKLITTPTEAEE